MPVVPPKPAVGPGNDCESGKRSNKSPCKTTTKSTLPSASSKLEKHFTPPIVRGQRVPTACLILSLCGGDRHPSMALFASASSRSTEHHFGTLPAAGWGRFYPPTGGASRAFGLPRAAAKRLFAGRSPHPLSAAQQLRLSSAPQYLRHRKQNKDYTQAP